MMQDSLRQQVKHLKANGRSYKQIAEAINVNQSSFYSWVKGNYDFKDSVARRLEQWITEELLNSTPRGNKNRTVRNLLSLLQQYDFQEGELLRSLPQYDSNERYYVTNLGNVFSLCGNEWLMMKPQLGTDGYYYVDIYCDGERTRKSIHSLVIEAFMPNLDLSGMEIHHLDQNRLNNELSNLLPVSKVAHSKIHQYLQKWRNSNVSIGDLDL